MAHAVKVHSKRTGSSQSAQTSATCPRRPFVDQFLAEWIDDRLGPCENRPLLFLLINYNLADHQGGDVDEAAVSEIILSCGGQVIIRPGAGILGVWGTTHCDPVDRARVVTAARKIHASAHQPCNLKCLIHVKSVSLPKDDANSAETAILVALAGLFGFAQTLASLPGEIFATEAFKGIYDLRSGRLSVSLPNTWFGQSDPVLYALDPIGAEASQDACQYTCHDAPPCIADSRINMAARLDDLLDLKPLILAAAIVGRVFTLELLAQALGMEMRRLEDALVAAQAAALISEERSPKGVYRYCFLDERLQRFAYEMVPPQQRLGHHRRIAEALRQSPVDSLASPPDQVARHHRIADNPLQSRRWLSKAAWRAVATDDAATAVAHLEKALAQSSPSSEVSASRRSPLQLLGVQLAVARGNGSDAVFDAYQQSIVTSGQLPYLTWRQEARSLWLAQSTHLVKGEVRAALTLGSLLLIHLQRQADRSFRTVGMRILVYRMHALSLMLSGQLGSALEHYDVVVRDYDHKHHARLRFAYGSDQLALAHAHRAWILALSCRSQEVKAEVQKAREVCEFLEHPHTTAHAMSVAAISLFSCGSSDAALFAAREARAIAVEYRFPYWVAWSDIILAATETPSKPRVASARLHDAMVAYQATGAAQFCPFVLGLLSAAALESHQHELALQQSDAGLALIAQNGCTLYRPELLRQRASALFALGRDDEADAALNSGFEQWL